MEDRGISPFVQDYFFQLLPASRLRASRLLSLGCRFRVSANSEFNY